jgi:hypothetical protein
MTGVIGPIVLNNVGSPTIIVAVAPITQLNIALFSAATQLNGAVVSIGAKH